MTELQAVCSIASVWMRISRLWLPQVYSMQYNFSFPHAKNQIWHMVD